MSFQRELLEWKNKYGSKIAFQEMDGIQKSYIDLYDDVLTYAKYFMKNKYTRMAVMGGTSYSWLCHTYGMIIARKTVVTVDPLLPADDIASLLKSTDVEVVFTDEKDIKLRETIEKEGIVYEEYVIPKISSETDWKIENKDGEIIFFTSGTSGKAKGVVIPFGAVYRNAQRLAEAVAYGIEGDIYIPLPLHHIYATTMTIVFVHKGQTVCLGNPRHILTEVAFFKPSVLVVVCAMAEFLMRNNGVGDWAKLFAVAGAKCDKRLERIAKEYGIFVQNLYGASETAGGIGVSKIEKSVDKMNAVKGVEVFIKKDGEIVIQASGHMKEYYKNPEATAEVLRDGKIYLGDVGEQFEDGTFSPLGRKQDVIAMSNGNKLYCDEMDEELSAVEGVMEACVIYSGGKVIAVVQKEPEIEEIAVRKSLKQYNKRQPYFRKVDEIWFRKGPLPRAGIGKLKRNTLVKEYESRGM